MNEPPSLVSTCERNTLCEICTDIPNHVSTFAYPPGMYSSKGMPSYRLSRNGKEYGVSDLLGSASGGCPLCFMVWRLFSRETYRQRYSIEAISSHPISLSMVVSLWNPTPVVLNELLQEVDNGIGFYFMYKFAEGTAIEITIWVWLVPKSGEFLAIFRVGS